MGSHIICTSVWPIGLRNNKIDVEYTECSRLRNYSVLFSQSGLGQGAMLRLAEDKKE